MPCCAVWGCKNDTHNKNGGDVAKGGGVSFHRFPKDSVVQKIWIQRCGREDKINIRTGSVCSDHFDPSDFSKYHQFLWGNFNNPQQRRLNRGAVPSLKLPRSGLNSDGRKAARGEAPQEAESGPDDPAERRRRSQQLRRERHERKERKELVEQLLAEHDRNQQEAAAAAAAETPAQVQAIVLNPEDDTRKTSVASEADADTDIDPEAEVEADADDEVEVKVPPTDSPAAEDPAGDSQSPPGAGVVRHSGPSVVTVCVRPLTKRPSLIVERTKKILRLKLRVRELEAKCLRVLGATGAPSSDTQDTGGGGEGRGAADEGEGQAENPERPQVNPAPAAGAMPLVVLRDQKLPAILTQLRQARQSDGLNMLTPSGLREAQEINHQLKVQVLGLQASVLKWVIKNKRMRDARLTALSRKAREGGEKHQRTVRAVRLRELLRLEAAVKAMFSEAQIRAMTRQHGDDSIPPSKRKGRSHWSDEDLRRVLELRAISSDRVVEHVRDKMKIPLPSMETTRKRCYKSPALNDVYREILQKNEDNRKLCAMCERQVTTINQVVEAAADEVPDDSATYGRQFVQYVPSPSPPRSPDQPATLSRPRKRRRAPAAAPVRTRKKVRTQAAASDDWAETDSDSELSDPGLWNRLGSSALDAVPGELSGRLDDHLRRQPPDPNTGMRKSWR